MVEMWKDIEGYSGDYQVSSYGRVKSFKKNMPIILRPAPVTGGYLQLALSKKGKPTNKKVHRLVAEAFIDNEHEYPEVNHIDEDKLNNCVENLEWCTSKYNCNYGTKNKRSAIAQLNHEGKSKPVKATSLLDGTEQLFPSISEAGRLGFNVGHITACCKGRRNQHGFCKWEYVLTKEEGAVIMAENKCICLDSKEWLTCGAVDASIYHGTGKSQLNIVDSSYLSVSEPVDLPINYCPFCGRRLQTEFDELTEVALRIRDIIHDSYPEKYDYYIGEMMRSPADVFSVAELIAEEVSADEVDKTVS